jgi:hypothetical protein
MTPLPQLIAANGRVAAGLAERMLKDVRPDQFARKPLGAEGRQIDCNHPAFIFGHLATYPAKWLATLGVDAATIERSGAAAPAEFDALFAAGKPCLDDPAGTIYPPMQTITEVFFRTHKAAFDQIEKLGDAPFDKPNPSQSRLKDALPTIAHMMIFYTTSHAMMHLGQASTWRRAMGLGSVM